MRTNHVWIGLTNIGPWMWKSGEQFKYSNWANGGPSDEMNKKCVKMLTSASTQWINCECNATAFFVCEYNVPTDVAALLPDHTDEHSENGARVRPTGVSSAQPDNTDEYDGEFMHGRM